MTQAELLTKLDEKALRNIAKNEELTIPNSYRKRDLVKFLEGTLTLQKIKEYTMETYEKETKRTIIHETIKEKGIRLKTKEIAVISFNKRAVIKQLANTEKIHPYVLEDISNRYNEPILKGKGIDLYNKMSDRMLETLNCIFIQKTIERKGEPRGLFLEFRTANFLKQNSKLKIEQIKVRQPLSGNEIDVVGFDKNGNPIVVAECKDRVVNKADLDKWIANSRIIFRDYKGTLQEACFVTSKRLSTENIERIKHSPDIEKDKGQLRMISGKLEKFGQFLFNDERPLKESGKVYLSIYEARRNQFNKVFPTEKIKKG